jgi:hypothetical protein
MTSWLAARRRPHRKDVVLATKFGILTDPRTSIVEFDYNVAREGPRNPWCRSCACRVRLRPARASREWLQVQPRCQATLASATLGVMAGDDLAYLHFPVSSTIHTLNRLFHQPPDCESGFLDRT